MNVEEYYDIIYVISNNVSFYYTGFNDWTLELPNGNFTIHYRIDYKYVCVGFHLIFNCTEDYEQAKCLDIPRTDIVEMSTPGKIIIY